MAHYIRVEHNDKLNEYIQGRMSGIIYALSGMPEIGYAWQRRVDGSELLRFDCTDEQFEQIREAINNCYGGVINYAIW